MSLLVLHEELPLGRLCRRRGFYTDPEVPAQRVPDSQQALAGSIAPQVRFDTMPDVVLLASPDVQSR